MQRLETCGAAMTLTPSFLNTLAVLIQRTRYPYKNTQFIEPTKRSIGDETKTLFQEHNNKVIHRIAQIDKIN